MNMLTMLIRLVVASILGGLIGLEREHHGRPAGFRTHLLVSIGSALTMMVSLHLYDLFKIYNTANYSSGVDPSRIASMVMTGIGFIGAGTIIQSRGSIWGLTTAACLWVSAALGLAVGCGYYMPAILVTIICLASLLLFKQPVDRFLKKDWYHHFDILMEDGLGGLEDIKRVFKEFGANVLKVDFDKYIPKNEISYYISVRFRNSMEHDLIDALAGVAGVKRVATS